MNILDLTSYVAAFVADLQATQFAPNAVTPA